MRLPITVVSALTVLLLVPVTQAGGVLGVDVAVWDHYSLEQWQCLAKAGYSFAVIEAWNGGIKINTDLKNQIATARQAGFSHTYIYMFISPPTVPAVDEVLAAVAPGSSTYDHVFIDIEQCSGCWQDAAENEAYIAKAAEYIESKGVRVGIYSSEYEWPRVMNGSTAFTKYPLWYADWDGQKSFGDGGYKFGGWNSAIAHQYADTAGCGLDADASWAPTFP